MAPETRVTTVPVMPRAEELGISVEEALAQRAEETAVAGSDLVENFFMREFRKSPCASKFQLFL